MVTKVQKWGNSQGLRVTKEILEEAQIGVGDEVKIMARKGRIIIEPLSKVRGKYTLEQLVAQMPKNSKTEEIDWGRPVGKEVW